MSRQVKVQLVILLVSIQPSGWWRTIAAMTTPPIKKATPTNRNKALLVMMLVLVVQQYLLLLMYSLPGGVVWDGVSSSTSLSVSHDIKSSEEPVEIYNRTTSVTTTACADD